MITILRYVSNEVATLGHLFKDEEYICDTLELPWNDNIESKSCIPEGMYPLLLRNSDQFHIKEGYEVQNVPNRTAILIHSANSVDQLRGCIAVGMKALELVYNSRAMLEKLISLIGDADTLKIIKFYANSSE